MSVFHLTTVAPTKSAKKSDVDELNAWHWLAIGVYLIALLLTLQHFHSHVPDPLPMSAPTNVFSETRARRILDELVSYGSKPAGSHACEVGTDLKHWSTWVGCD